jgi:hypothetical protein
LNGILPGNSIRLHIRLPKEINLRARSYATLEIEADDMADFFDEDYTDSSGGGARSWVLEVVDERRAGLISE